MLSQKHSEIITRTLLYIPIVHTQADMGALGSFVRKASLNKIGKTALKRKIQAIGQVWTHIESVIKQLNISFVGVRLYQDGLPVCGQEELIVKDLAASGSRNHRLLQCLIEKGAILMGTESPELLRQEYERISKIISTGDTLDIAKTELDQGEMSRSLLAKRDRFIADRINATLRTNETGILFLGTLHSPIDRFAQDIRIIYPTHGPRKR